MKIFTNGYPRSGTTNFTNSVLMSTKKLMGSDRDQLCHNKHWVMKNHNPILFLGSYPSDITICTIVRNPLDAISSNSFRWAKGYTGNMIQGLLVMNEENQPQDQRLSDHSKATIEHQIDQYISYMFAILQNPENIVMFTYEQTKNNLVWCIKTLVGFTEMDVDKIETEMDKIIMYSPNNASDEKTDLYFGIKEYIKGTEKYQQAVEYYDKVMSILKEKQLGYSAKPVHDILYP